MSTRPCIRCRGTTQPTVLENAASETDAFALRIEGMPLLACEAGHRQFVSPEFPRWVIEHLMEADETKLPFGRVEGMLFKHHRCGGCGAELAKTPERRETFAVDVALREQRPFRIKLTAPVYRCPDCSREQLHSLEELRNRTPQALAAAFRAAEIPPA